MDAGQVEYARTESHDRVGWCFVYLDLDGTLSRHLFFEFRNSLRVFRKYQSRNLTPLCIARNGVIMVTRKGGAS